MYESRMAAAESVTDTGQYPAVPGHPAEGKHKADRSARASRRSLSREMVSGLVLLTDAIIVLGAGFAVFLLRFEWAPQTPSFVFHLSTLLIGSALTLQGFHLAGLYRFESIIEPARQIKRLVLVCGLVFVSLLLLAFALKVSASFSRVWMFSWFACQVTLVLLARMGWDVLLRSSGQSGKLTRKIAVVGADRQAADLVSRISRMRNPWIDLVGIFDHRPDNHSAVSTEDSQQYDSCDDLVSYARKRDLDEVIVTWSASDHLSEFHHSLKELPVEFRFLGPDVSSFRAAKWKFNSIAGVPTLDLAYTPLAGWRLLVKGLLDKVLALMLMILIGPLMLLIALVIKLDSPGPALFVQKRYGYNNRPFSVYKFRTMRSEFSHETRQARRNDARVTRIGAWLRRFSLDELPQLFNVINGSMSLIGPRPHPIPLNVKFADRIEYYYARHRIKPGITGWAQVNGLRGETETAHRMKKRIEYDLYYIENWSIVLDLQILFATVRAVVSQKNAY